MKQWIQRRLALVLIASAAVVALSGAAAITAAQAHIGPFAQFGALNGGDSSTTGSSTTGSSTTKGDKEYHAQGTISSISFDTGSTTSGTLLFVPTGQTAAISVTFTAKTHVDIEDGNNSGDTTAKGDSGNGSTTTTVSNPLTQGATVAIEGIQHADGTVTATEIELTGSHAGSDDGDDHQGTPGPDDDGHHTPTPGAGGEHQTPTPKPGD
jgi:hypothetical protein